MIAPIEQKPSRFLLFAMWLEKRKKIVNAQSGILLLERRRRRLRAAHLRKL